MDPFLNRKPQIKRPVTLVLSLLTITALLITGCTKESAPKTVESIVNSDEQIASTIKGGADESGVNVDIKDNNITYSYDISSVDGITEEMLENEEFSKSLQTSLDGQKTHLAGICKSIEEQAGLEGVVVKVVYTYGDKEILSTTVTSADAASDEAAADKAEEGSEE